VAQAFIQVCAADKELWMVPSITSARPAKLWKALTEERRLAAAEAFWRDEQAVAEQAEAVGVIARQINFRPKSVLSLPPERKARLLVRSAQLSDTVAARLLVVYHLALQRPMMAAFLDALGLKHEEGLLADDIQAPPKDTLVAAARTLFQAFPAEDVQLYFTTLLLQDPATWSGLQDVLAEPA
jgi:hypothetical protein